MEKHSLRQKSEKILDELTSSGYSLSHSKFDWIPNWPRIILLFSGSG